MIDNLQFLKNISKHSKSLFTVDLDADVDYQAIEPPDIVETDDIGLSEGYVNLVNARAGINTNHLKIKPAINSDKYSYYDPTKTEHDFEMSIIYKDVEGMGNQLKEYQDILHLESITLSFDNLVASALEDGYQFTVPDIMQYLQESYDKCISTLKDKKESAYKTLFSGDNTSIYPEDLKNLSQKHEDVKIEGVAESFTEFPALYISPIGNIDYPCKEPQLRDYTDSDYLAGKFGNFGPVSEKKKEWYIARTEAILKHPDLQRDISSVNELTIHSTDGGGTVTHWYSDKPSNNDRLRGVGYTHFVINQNGIINFTFPLHVGLQHSSSSGYDKTRTIGVEMVCPKNQTDPFTNAQYQSLIYLITEILMKQNGIQLTKLSSHDHNRELHSNKPRPKPRCPAPGFDWNRLMDELSKVNIHSVNASLDDSNRDTIKRTTITTRFTLDNKEVQKKVVKILESINKNLQPVIKDILIEAYSVVYKLHSINYTSLGVVQDIQIQWKPGSSAAIKMEGENAPLVQSTGGRIKQAVIKFRVSDYLELAKLSMMFSVSNSTDNLVSMLMMTRSVYKGSASKNRLRHIASIKERELLNRNIRSIFGNKTFARFDEPVRIKNDFLNSVGMETFLPYSMEAIPVSENPGAFDIIITFNSINLGIRSFESLKKYKQGSNLPLYPLIARNAPDPETHSETTSKETNTDKLLSSLALIGTRFAISEFMPIYILSKLYHFRNNMIKYDDVIDSDNIVEMMKLASGIPLDVINNELEDALNSFFDSDMEGRSTYARGADVAFSVVEILTTLGIALGTGGSSKKTVMADITKMGKRGAKIAVAGSASIGATAAYSQLPGSISDNSIIWNVLYLVPFYFYEMLSDYSKAIGTNSINTFIEKTADDAIKLIELISKDEGISLPIGKKIKIKSGDNIRTVDTIDIVFYADQPTLRRKHEEIQKYIQKTYTKSKIESMDKSDLLFMNIIMLQNWVMTIVSDLNSLNIRSESNMFKGDTFKAYKTISDMYQSARKISTSGEYQAIINESIMSVITSSYIDTLTGSFIFSNNLKTSNKSDTFTRTVNNLYINRQKNARKVVSRYNTRPEIISGNIMTDRYPSDEVRIAVSETMQIVVKTITNTMFSFDESQPISIGSILNTIDPDRSTMTLSRMRDSYDTITGFIDEIKIAIIVTFLEIGVAAAAGAGVGSIATSVAAFVAKVFKICYTLYEFGALYLGIISLNIITTVIRNGNPLVFSRWILGTIRTSLDQLTLVRMGYQSGIWCKELLNYGEDILENNMSSYMDFPIVYYQGIPMMPDFYVSRIGFIGESFNTMMDRISSVISVAEEKAEDLDMNDYKSLMDELYQRLTGIDENLLKTTAVKLQDPIYNISRNSGYYFNPENAGRNPSIITKGRNELLELSNVINKILYPDGREGILYVSLDGENNQKAVIAKDKCVLTFTISRNDTLKIDVNKRFYNMIDLWSSHVNYDDNAYIMSGISGHSGYNTDTLTFLSRYILGLLYQLKSMAEQHQMMKESLSPGTLNNLMLARSLVGSYMKSIGVPGVQMMKERMIDDTYDMINSTVKLSSGYLFPAVKLFFIEEDSEAYYLFDDLYSYASIISFDVHEFDDSPVQTLQLQVTNIHGYLTDINSDMFPEYGPFNDHHPESQMNSAMLKIGCKIKLQSGNTPLLTEEDTIFVGRITNITPGEIMTIEAQSNGSSLMQDISKEKVVVFGDESQLYTNYVSKGWAAAKRWVVNLFSGSNYKKPIDDIKAIIGYALTAGTLQGKFDDYSINPALITDFDGDIELTANNFNEAIRTNFFPDAIGHTLSLAGVDATVGNNKQLFENIMLNNVTIYNRQWSVSSSINTSAWVSLDDTLWDILKDVNLLLPNQVLKTAPYDTRSTLVWGDENSYYRYRRNVDFDTMVSTSIADTIRFKMNQGSNFVAIIENLIKHISSDNINSEQIEKALGVYIAIVYYAANIIKAFLANSDVYYNSFLQYNLDFDPSTPEGIKEGLKLGGIESITVKQLSDLISQHEDVMKSYNKSLPENTDTMKELNISVHEIINEYSSWISSSSYSEMASTVITSIALEMAAEFYINRIYNSAASVSTSYKRICRTHIKTSGRDIISNNIQIKEPYNAVHLTFPESNSKSIMNFEPSDRKEIPPTPIHYKLEPRMWNVYSAFYRNINIFPSSTTSTRSMVHASIMNNLISQMYDGYISFLGDSRINCHDLVFLNDENRDLFGLIRVREKVISFNRETGYTTTIKPSLYSRNDYILDEITGDWIFSVISHIATLALVGGALYLGGRGYKFLQRETLIGSHANSINHETLSKAQTHISNVFDSISGVGRAVVKPFTFTRSKIGSIFRKTANVAKIDDIIKEMAKLEKGNFIKRIVKDALDRKKNIENIWDNLDIYHRVDDLISSSKLDISFMDSGTWRKLVNDATVASFTPRMKESKEINKHFMGIFEKKITEYLKNTARINDKSVIDNVLEYVRDAFSKNEGFRQVDNLFADLAVYTRGTLSGVGMPQGMVSSTNEMNRAAEAILDGTIYNKSKVYDTVMTVVKRGGAIFLGASFGSAIYNTAKEVSELALTSGLTADNITISPLFFRGNPYVAGLDGINKKEGEEAGLYDIIKSRLGSAFKGIYHGMTDTPEELYYEALHTYKETMTDERYRDR